MHARISFSSTQSYCSPGLKRGSQSLYKKFVVKMSSLYLGLDVGTQSTKCVVVNENYNVVGRGSKAYGLISSRPGQAEQHPRTWIDACILATHRALDGLDSTQIKGISVSGQQHGLIVLDNEMEIIRPAKLWCDVESSREAEELSTLLDDPSIVPSTTITKIVWMKNNEPDLYAKIYKILLPHDYINFWLTGNFAVESSDASGTGVWDPKLMNWDCKKIRIIDEKLIDCFVHRIVGPNEVIGTVLPEVASQLIGESSHREPIVVGPGGGDNAMSAIGAGVVSPGQWVVSLGTSGTLFGPTDMAVTDPLGIICPFVDAAGAGGLPLLCTLNCTSPPEEIRTAFHMSRDEINRAAAAQPPGSQGLTFLPFLAGERTPCWPHATGTILGLRPGLFDAGVLYRAALEGVTFSLVSGMKRLMALGFEAKQLYVVGGGSRNLLWRTILADAFQLPLKFPAEPDCAAYGAALQAAAVFQGISVGDLVIAHPPAVEDEVVMPNRTVAEEYVKALDRFESWGGSLFGGSRSVV